MDEQDWGYALSLMQLNMQPYHARHSLPWDVERLWQNYGDKHNFLISGSERRIGFLSIEPLSDKLHIHTLQLHPDVHSRRHGLYALRFIVGEASNRKLGTVSCCTFIDHPAREMYERLGFKEASSRGALVSLQASVPHLAHLAAA